MLCFTTSLTALVALASAAIAPAPYSVFQLDLTPEQAQQYLKQPPIPEPQLAGRTAILPLVRYNDPRFRSADAGPTNGHYWKNGHEIENTDDYVEEVYNAAQYHGQDGLGAYGYGYETPESSKVENRVRSGDVSGSYIYKDGNNDLIKVRYWSDGTGFHQEDNVPRDQPKPVEETDEVKQARLAHQQAWESARAAALLQPDPHGEYKPSSDEHPNWWNESGYQAAASENQGVYLSNPEQSVEAIAARAGRVYKPQSEELDQPEPTGPPRGFFYSFTYPVSIISAKSQQAPGTALDHDTVSISNKQY